MRKSFRIAVMSASMLVGSAHLASAAPTPAQRADATMKEGAALEKSGKVEAALAKYEESYALVPTGAAAYQVAHAEAALGKHALALQHYREALRDSKLGTDQRRDAEAAIEQLKTKIGILTLDVPESATTTVDGNEVDPKQAAEVTPGLHVVKIRLGGESKSQDVQAPAGAVTPVKLRFGDDAAPAPVASPSTASPSTTPTSAATHWPTAKLVTVGATAAVGAGLMVVSLIEDLTADDTKAPNPMQCQNRAAAGCAALADRRDSYDAHRTGATVFFYSGLVLLAASAVTAFVWPNDKPSNAAKLRPGLRSTQLLLQF